MKKALAIFVLFSLLFQSMAHYSVIALFELRRDYIAQHLCENRNKPTMKCGGKCYLKKQLKATDESSNSSKNTTLKTEKQEIVAYVLPLQVPIAVMYTTPVKRPFNPGQQHMKGYDPLLIVFHPPSYLG